MTTLFRLFFLLLLTVSLSYTQVFSAINFGVTPIKYELTMAPWESKTLPMSIRNNGTESVTMPTSNSDFTSSGLGWTPKFVRKSELVFPDQQLSSWITIEDSSLTAAAGEQVTTNFTIDVPTTATPGWHYGAVFFKRQSGEVSSGGNIWIDVDYGIIILVNVEWDVIVDVEIDEPIISNKGNWDFKWSGDQWLFDDGFFSYTPNTQSWYVWDDSSGQAVYQNPDSCPLGDFTTSKYDNKCFSITEAITPRTDDVVTEDDINSNPGDNNWIPDDFNVSFDFPLNNIGNTHIKPTWKIVLKDENWNIIKAVWKESVANEQGAIIWENIVDYIPINDQGGNVLPKTQRVFESEWRWFPYKVWDDDGNKIIQYWSPSEYYTEKNKQDAGFLMLWERVSESRQHKTITAEIELIYYDEEWNPIEFTSAQEFPVQYIEQRVTTNPYAVLALLLVFTAGLFLWFGMRWFLVLFKRNKCWNCKEKIKSHWETCPHCSAIQDKKKHKAYEEQKKAEVTKKAPIKRKVTTKKTPTKKATTKKTTVKKAPTKK
jgi:hypothetical protein